VRLNRSGSSIVKKASPKKVSPASSSEASCILSGALAIRPVKGGDDWPFYSVYLHDSELIIIDNENTASDGVSTTDGIGSDGSKNIHGSFKITPNCSVFETNLGAYTFELVTSKRVLHMKAGNSQTMMNWITHLRDAIQKSILDTNDPLFQAAMLLIDDDEFYDVTFTEKKPLGVVFERAGEWAIVKSSTVPENGIVVGSVLSSVNMNSVVLGGYQYTIELLKNWQPPLRLGFRLAPEKAGFLLKESKSRKDPTKRVWKKRYFCLGHGKLCYKDTQAETEPFKGEIPLMGSAVSLVPAQQAGKFFCFRFMSGVIGLTLQSATERQVKFHVGCSSTLRSSSFLVSCSVSTQLGLDDGLGIVFISCDCGSEWRFLYTWL
jgi:PH domain